MTKIKKQILASKEWVIEGFKTRKNITFSIVFVTALVYILWRLFFTLPLNHGVASMVFGISLWIAEAIAVLESFTHFHNARKVKFPKMPKIPDALYPEVDVMVVTHNEPVDLLYKTLNGCKHMKYPDKSKVRIHLCDDKNRPEMAELAAELDVNYWGLSGNKTAKAGNLNHALKQTSATLVAVFDADMIPMSDFLLETVPYFYMKDRIEENGIWRARTDEDEPSKEKDLGYVQTRQSFYHPDLWQMNLYMENHVPNEQDYFYRSVNVARMHTDSAAFAGSNTLFSRKALEENGGFQEYSITEDLATSIPILSSGYRSIALDKELAHGQNPADTMSLIKQRQRWSRGSAQVISNSRFWKSKLSLKAKGNFIMSYVYWWTFVRRLIFIMAPIMYTVFNVYTADVTFWQLMLVWFPYLLIYNRGLKLMAGNTTNSLWSNVIDVIQFPYLITPIIAGTLKIPHKKFFVTPSVRQQGRNSHFILALPHLILTILTLISAYVCARGVFVHHNEGLIIVLFWSIYNLFTLLLALVYYKGRVVDTEYEQIKILPMNVVINNGAKEMMATTELISDGDMEIVPADGCTFIHGHDYNMTIKYKDYTAKVIARLQHEFKENEIKKYKVALRFANVWEKQQYLQIVYDRKHLMANKTDFTPLRAIKRILVGMASHSTINSKYRRRTVPKVRQWGCSAPRLLAPKKLRSTRHM